MDSQQLEPVSGPLSLSISYNTQDSTTEDGTPQGLPAGSNDSTPNAEILLNQDAINAYYARDPAEFELLIALRIRHVHWIFEIPHRRATRAKRLLASIRQRLPTFEFPSQYSTVDAVTLFIAATCISILYSLLDSLSPIFQAKQADFIPFKYVDCTNTGPDIKPYIDGLHLYAATALQLLGPLLSLVISQGWLVDSAKLANTAFTNNNSTRSTSQEEEYNGIAGTAGDLLVKMLRIWLRAQ